MRTPEGATLAPARPASEVELAITEAPHRLGRLATLLCVLGATLLVFFETRPDLVFGPGTDVGGDNAAHIVAANYLIHSLLPHLQLTGWDPQWWGGFPLYVFYFPLPAVVIAALTPIFHYTVAFKIVTLLGSWLMPLACYLFGRLTGFARPFPALFAIASLPFLFNTSYTIDGGNLASTLAGEFSFTLALTLAIVFLGCFSYSLRTGRLRWLAAVLFPLVMLCHVVPALFAASGAVALTLVHPRRRFGLRILASIGLTGALLGAFWFLRFAADIRYSSSMGYTKIGDPVANLFPPFPSNAEVIVQALSGLALALALWRRQRTMIAIALLAVGAALAFWLVPSGTIYNGRWLPFWFLTTALLATYAVGELARTILTGDWCGLAAEWLAPTLTGLATVGVVLAYLGQLPALNTSTSSRSFLPSWVQWNYSGYQAKPGWPEFSRLVSMLERAAQTHGCGRLDYEYSANVNNYFGSTLVPMSFPYWTGGCIDSEEGLYYESSTTTPYHFLDQSELSLQPSNPVVGLPYQGLDLVDGIHHLQLEGVRYYLANSAEIEQQAAADADLVEIASMPASPTAVESSPGTTASALPARWVLYEIRNSSVIVPLSYEPVIVGGATGVKWQQLAIAWYQNPADWSVPVTSTGPATWLHSDATTVLTPGDALPLRTNKVSDVHLDASSLSFNVAHTGLPVLVRIPFFPNWQAVGATGPYLATPNLMVVVPTSHHVELHYGTTTVEWLGRLASLVGLASLLLLRRPLPLPLPRAPGAATPGDLLERAADHERSRAPEEA